MKNDHRVLQYSFVKCWSSAVGGEPTLKQHWLLAYRNKSETSNKTLVKRYSPINHVNDVTT